MPQFGIRLVRVTVIAVALALGAGAAVIKAQGNSPLEAFARLLGQLQDSINAVQQSVDAVQQGVNGVQQDVTAIKQGVDALGATTNYVFTPMVRANSGIIDCNYVNVTAEPRHVEMILVNANTGEAVVTDPGAAPTQPGRRRSVGAFVPGGFNGSGYCKFTVLDGVKSDIRANLTLTPGAGGDETTTVSVDAQ